MSTSQRTPTAVSCQYTDCEKSGQEWEFKNGKYCCTEHYRRDHGRRLLDAIKHRHELCYTCFRRKKDIERPPTQYMRTHFGKSGTGWSRENEDAPWTVERWGQETSRESVCGFASPTEHASMGDHGLECVCGAVESDLDEPAVRELEHWSDWLAETVRYLTEVGARDGDTFRPRVAEHAYERTGDLEYSVGMGLTFDIE